MLKITIPSEEFYDEEKEEFVTSKERTIRLEHSLISLSKWESHWCKPFLKQSNKTDEEIIDYIKCMCIDDVPDSIIYSLTSKNIEDITKYMYEPKTATIIHDTDKGSNESYLTSEVIYWLMIMYKIPFECEKWHLDRLLTLIHVCKVKAAPPKHMSQSEINELNKKRREARNSKG